MRQCLLFVALESNLAPDLGPERGLGPYLLLINVLEKPLVVEDDDQEVAFTRSTRHTIRPNEVKLEGQFVRSELNDLPNEIKLLLALILKVRIIWLDSHTQTLQDGSIDSHRAVVNLCVVGEGLSYLTDYVDAVLT